ncbi:MULTISPECIES: hypothetical protein [Bradyrhizobium]|nr:hypothetical protein [Bradyrhizobium vignae]
MGSIASALVFALAMSASAAFAQTAKPDVSPAPSAQNVREAPVTERRE